MGATGWQFFFILFFFFPNGKAVPAWTRWLALAWLGVILLTLFVDLAFLTSRAWFYILLVLTATGSQVYRYFWRSSGVERQQSRWVIATVILMMIYIALVASWAFQPPSGEDLRLSLVLSFVNLLFITILVALFPMAVAMAIFRYRLWDIDLVIRRTLVYAVLTALLGLGYYGLITVLQGLFVSASGQQSPLALVISTLVIAALSSPLRRRVQQLIDRRFFRQRYDSTQAVERFSHNLRQLADLPGVEKELMRVVQETLQPERVSLWITDPQTIQQEQKA